MWWPALLLAPLFFVPAAAKAQDTKPVLVISIAPINNLLVDVKYLAETAGSPEFGGVAQFMVKGNADGVDFARPAGVVVVTDGIEFSGFGFVPLANNGLKKLLAKVEQTTGREARDAGNGLWEIPVPQRSVFVKEAGGWAYLAADQEHLKNLPVDPTKLLGDLPSKYDVAVSAMVHNIPQNYRDIALAQMRAGYQQALERAAEQDEDQAELMRALGKRAMEQWGQLINEMDRLSYGIVVDATQGTTYLETEMTAIEGSKLARQFAQAGEAKSDYTGFRLPGAAVHLSLAQKIGQEDLTAALSFLQQGRAAALRQIDKDEDLPSDEARAAAKEVVGDFMDVIAATLKSGKLDGGAALNLAPKSLTLVGGGHIVDGAAMEKILKKVAELAKNEPDFPGIKWNAAKHGNVNLHTLQAPVDKAEAREVIGDKLDIVIGIGPSSFYFAAGKDAMETLKKVIDDSAAGAEKMVSPIEMVVRMKPIIDFMASVKPEDENLARISKQFAGAGDRDRVKLTYKAIPNGASSRIEIEDGIIKAFVPKQGGDAAPGF
jgi:hypothetical protein